MYNELSLGIVAETAALRQECESLRKDAERYRHLRDRSKTRLRVWRPENDGGATGPFDLTRLDAAIAAEISRASAVGAV